MTTSRNKFGERQEMSFTHLASDINAWGNDWRANGASAPSSGKARLGKRTPLWGEVVEEDDLRYALPSRDLKIYSLAVPERNAKRCK